VDGARGGEVLCAESAMRHSGRFLPRGKQFASFLGLCIYSIPALCIYGHAEECNLFSTVGGQRRANV